MQDFESPASSTSEKSQSVLWPSCAYIGGLECVAHALGRHLGPEINARLAEFVGEAEPGARLTLQKGKGGFTLQITSEIVRADLPGEIRLTGLADMSKALNDQDDSPGDESGDEPGDEPENGPANETPGRNQKGSHGAAPHSRPATNGRSEST